MCFRWTNQHKQHHVEVKADIQGDNSEWVSHKWDKADSKTQKNYLPLKQVKNQRHNAQKWDLPQLRSDQLSGLRVLLEDKEAGEAQDGGKVRVILRGVQIAEIENKYLADHQSRSQGLLGPQTVICENIILTRI